MMKPEYLCGNDQQEEHLTWLHSKVQFTREEILAYQIDNTEYGADFLRFWIYDNFGILK